ncbi:MAG: tetratricopeptide repeat protein [Aridibacter sp.]
MKMEMQSYKKTFKTLSALLIIFTFYIVIMPNNSFAFETNSNASEKINQDDFDKKFREGRDLIDKEEWAKAAEKFKEAINKNPNNKSVDAALYWLAFCHKKLDQTKEADATIDRLLKEFPNSNWTSDARVLKAEMGFSFYFSTANKELIASISKNNQGTEFSKIFKNLQRPQLDREDEIKLAAFQSLLSADAERAIKTLGEILKTDSTASETFKLEAIRFMRKPNLSRGENQFSAGGGLNKKFVPLLRDTLIESFKDNQNMKIRKEIIFALSGINDDQAINYLARLYDSENNKEIKKTIINSYGDSPTYFFTDSANYIFINSSDASPSRKILFDNLWKIVRTEKDSELRRLALSKLLRFDDRLANAEVINELKKIYDAENDEQFKISLIRTFARIKQDQATKKLLDIAGNEKSDKLKLEAIYALKNSNDPEVLKFLEQLIK